MYRKPAHEKYTLNYLSWYLFTYFGGTANGQLISTIAGNGSPTSLGDAGLATAASFNNPGGAYYDSHGNIYVVEYSGDKIRKIDPSKIVNTFAGTGVAGFWGDGGPASAAMFRDPIDLISDVSGNLYIVDNGNQRLRKIDPSGIITTFAGNGSIGYTGDGGPATNATLHDPSRLAIDAAGNIYFSDANNNVIRKVDVSGIITTVAGNGTPGFGGDGGPATAASLNQPLGEGFDGHGNMYIADHMNHRIRKISPMGIITTCAGTGVAGSTGDGAPATVATVDYPNGIAVDQSCNVYFTDWNAQKVRKITAAGIISTVVGNGTPGFSGDGGIPTSAQLDGPNNLTFDAIGNLYIPDFYNNRVRKVANLGESTGCPVIYPTASFTATGSAVCQDSCITFTNTSSGTVDSIRWVTNPATGSIASPTSNVTDICFPGSGPVIVKIYAYGIGRVDSSFSTYTVNPTPYPLITQSGHTLTASGGPYSSYQWYNSSGPIAGATNATYTFSIGATYWVSVDSGGCKGLSGKLNVSTGVRNFVSINDLTLFPNPAKNTVCIQLPYSNGTGSIVLQNEIGQEIAEQKITGDKATMDLGKLSSGLYIIRINIDGQTIYKKIAKD